MYYQSRKNQIGIERELKDEKSIKEKVKESQQQYNAWRDEFPYRTRESLTNWGRQLMIPAKEYYSHLFTDPKGDCSNIVHMAEAAELFNSVITQYSRFTQ